MINAIFRHSLSVAVLLFAFLLPSCTDNQVVGQKPDSDRAILAVTDALHPSNFDRVITVKGVIKAVCQDEGCWMTITDGKTTLRMTFKDEAFRVGLKSTGNVLVTGIIHEEIVSEEAAHAIGPTMGMSDKSLQQLSGDQRWPLMTANGVEFLQPQP